MLDFARFGGIPMRAIICTKYGPPEVLQLREVEKPSPKKKEILVKVLATTVSSGDCRMRSFSVPASMWIPARLALGLTKPRRPIPGLWLAGIIEAVGEEVSLFHNGDQVYARTPDLRLGAYAEYVCLPENGLIALKPLNVTYEEIVAIPFGGVTALYFLKRAKVCRGQKVLIYGASGAVGTAAVQLAKSFGAEVTGVCSTKNVDLVKSLGAHKVIDYLKDDFTKTGDRFDLIFDAVGKISFLNSKQSLGRNGKFLSVLGSDHANVHAEDLVSLNELVETGQIKPVIDRRYPLEQMVEAHRYAEGGHKKGNIVITMEHAGKI
jgi:NADPH:quinone reductase-like Zn-dependent oxidoreductase